MTGAVNPRERGWFLEVQDRLHLAMGSEVGYWELVLPGEQVTWSAVMCEIMGVARDFQPTVADYRQRIHPEDRARQAEAMERALRERCLYDAQYRIVRPGGEVRLVHSVAELSQDGTRFYGILKDVTELRRSEESLRLFRTLVDHSDDCVEVIDPRTGRFLDVNQKACEVHGYTREEYLSLTVADVDPQVAAQPWEDVLSQKQLAGSYLFESEHRRKDGSLFPVEVNCTVIELERTYWLAVVRDVTERRRASRALEESHNLLQAVVEGTPDAVFVKDRQGRYVLINQAGAAMLGRSVEQILGRDDCELLGLEESREMRERDRLTLTTGEPTTFEETLTVGGGSRTVLVTKGCYRDQSGEILGLVGIARDVSDLKRLEAQFRQAQKMEAVGQLAGGIAHDFNNLLTVINTYSEMLLESLEPDDSRREMLADIRGAGLRAATLTRQLLAFSRQQILQPKIVDLNELLLQLGKLLQRLLGEDVELRLELEPSLGRARVDVGHFEQAIINLAVNARDAMPDGGRLVLSTANATIAGEPFVRVAVGDSGHGIDESVRPHLFEPFFTTKGPGRGTGLGLAMVYGFVKQSGGHLEVDSEVGRGTTFNLHLPRAGEGPPQATTRSWPRGTETLLLVEDERAVRDLASRVLRECGYTVLEAADGEEALLVARRYSGQVDLLVTDIIMPRMSGRSLAEQLLRQNPGLRVLFISGYPLGQVVALTEAYLHKPFGPAELCQRVRDLLDGKT